VRKNYEVAIIGTGPSGAFAAYNLAKKGISTVIIDKETLPRYKICVAVWFIEVEKCSILALMKF
jgi:flavin-dependent dehydrogenase